jgi:hypothetical protein
MCPAVAQDCDNNTSDTSFALTPFQTQGYAGSGIPFSLVDNDSSRVATYTVSRVVGPGVAGTDIDSNGYLLNWDTLVDVNHQIVSRYANVQITPGLFIEGGPITYVANAYFNGRPLIRWETTPTGLAFASENPWRLVSPGTVCVSIETKYVKFATKGGTAGDNKIGVSLVVTDDYYHDPATITGAASYGGNLSFQAMAPIVLVHGWNTGPWAWDQAPATNGTFICPTDSKDRDPGDTGPQNFIQGLIDAKAPFDCSFNTNDIQSSILDGAAKLKAQLPGILNKFGSTHVNIVTHSKGGLFVRRFLKSNDEADPSAQFLIVSATTLDTPHHGSVLSDTVVVSRSDRSVVPGLGFAQPLFPFLIRFWGLGKIPFIHRLRNAFGSGNDDMTVLAVEGFNSQYKTPPDSFVHQFPGASDVARSTPVYYATAANADLNGDQKLQANEASPYNFFVAKPRYQRLGSILYITLTTDSFNRPLGVLHAADQFQDNDTAVTVKSATYPPFALFGSYLRNHATIKKPDVATDLLIKIRQAEQAQPK